MHVIGVAYKDSNKNGMYKQVGKATVFNKESLVKIQDEMRERCIEAFNRIYKVDYVLKDKEQGRNKDINVKDMENYSKFKKEKEKCDIELNRLNKSANNLKDNSKEVLELLHNLKPTTFNKNAYHLCADGLIPQRTYDEFSELFNDNKGKWINGKYYTKEQL